jgi:hypothetical protein
VAAESTAGAEGWDARAACGQERKKPHLLATRVDLALQHDLVAGLCVMRRGSVEGN